MINLLSTNITSTINVQQASKQEVAVEEAITTKPTKIDRAKTVNPVTKSDKSSLLAAQEEASQDTGSSELTEEEEKIVREMKQRDSEVRSHEQAHKTVGGPYAGAIQLETETGPDGREYAVAGEVQIDVSPVDGNPEATIRKMEVVARAALAPAEPSSADIQVAQAANQIKIQAQSELRKQNAEEQNGSTEQKTILEELISSYTENKALKNSDFIDLNT